MTTAGYTHDQEHVLQDGITLVSTTDLQGRITHCNPAFATVSGYEEAELLGQPHNVVRHPDMPSELFADMWATVGFGRPWSAVIKNRRKDGSFYWSHTNVSPVMRGGRPTSYMSVRVKATPEQIRAAQALYDRVADERRQGVQTFKIHAGQVRRLGWRDFAAKRHRLTLSQRFGLALATIIGLGQLPAWWLGAETLWLGIVPMWVLQVALQAAGAWAMLAWLDVSLLRDLAKADRLASEISGCNLTGTLDYTTTSPIGSLLRRLWLINLNMRAIVTDVRGEVNGMVNRARNVYESSLELAGRTENQATGVEQASASVEQMAGSVGQTVSTAQNVSQLSEEATQEANRGREAVDAVTTSMNQIQGSSQRITAIIDVIDGLAFQTTLLALNAAVEAAHAGDAGRGFAVVASEVRALARRSSSAANQIRDIIRESVKEVESGAASVDHASATIRHAVDSVKKVGEVLTQITDAATDQSERIARINEAMQLLDKVTQQNASQADSSAKACSELERQAQALQRAVVVFQIN